MTGIIIREMSTIIDNPLDNLSHKSCDYIYNEIQYSIEELQICNILLQFFSDITWERRGAYCSMASSVGFQWKSE